MTKQWERRRRTARATRTAGLPTAAAVLAIVALSMPATLAALDERSRADRFDTVVIDAGHGGSDEGAVGSGGLVEKRLVLDVARLLASRLRDQELRVVMTRDDDVFIPLEERTNIANDARGDLFISIHANAAPDRRVRGVETFFLSLEASDESARRVALRENRSFGESVGGALPTSDPLLAVLGDLIAKEHLQESSEFARMAQTELAALEPKRSRGVKQAPFVVLSGVQMPASLVEIGFLTNRADERQLLRGGDRGRIVAALTRAVLEFGRRYDARRGVSAEGPPASKTPPGSADRGVN